jgi:hypothetical protein
MTSHAQNDEQQPGIGRRRIVRSAAMLAWTVPAIQVVSAVPALAASACCNLTGTGTAQWRVGSLNYIDIALDITNSCGAPVSGLTLTLTICGVNDVTYSGAVNLPDGWTQAGKANQSPDPVDGCYNLTYTSGMTLDGGASTQATFTAKSMAYVGSGHHRPAGTITAYISSAGCNAPPLAIDLPNVG